MSNDLIVRYCAALGRLRDAERLLRDAGREYEDAMRELLGAGRALRDAQARDDDAGDPKVILGDWRNDA